MRKKRYDANGKYYCISNPTEVNLHTGNYCVAFKYISKYDKDFLFDWVDPHTHERITKVLPKEYVIKNYKPCP